MEKLCAARAQGNATTKRYRTEAQHLSRRAHVISPESSESGRYGSYRGLPCGARGLARSFCPARRASRGAAILQTTGGATFVDLIHAATGKGGGTARGL